MVPAKLFRFIPPSYFLSVVGSAVSLVFGGHSMRRTGTALVVLLMLALCSTASGQSVTATTGTINGRVTDTSGAILPGVSITIASESMQGTRTAVTSDDG